MYFCAQFCCIFYGIRAQSGRKEGILLFTNYVIDIIIVI